MSAAILRYEAGARHEARPARTADPARSRLQRGDGAASIVFGRRGTGTSLVDLYQRTPCRVLFPRPEPDGLPVAVLLTTSGGITGGDGLRVSAEVTEGAAAIVTTQAAEKIYRSLDADATVAVSLAVGTGGWLEYLPQETILFEGARLDRRTEARLAPDARLLACEMVMFGRLAREEALTRGKLHDAWRIKRGDRLIWADALRLDGDIAALLAAPAGFGEARALATALYVGSDAESLMPLARELAESGDSRGGASLVNGVLIARFLGPRPELVRRDLMRYVTGLRQGAGRAATLPRVWHS
jgi:urease accessory protein